MTEAIEIARYSYHFFSSREEHDAVILLYDDEGRVVGQLSFVEESHPLPAARKTDRKLDLYFRRARLLELVDLLRNEEPIYLSWGGETNTSLCTECELIGEAKQLMPC